MPTPLQFACQMMEAIPEPVCLYLGNTDLIIPNRRWREEVGAMSRIHDMTAVVSDFAQFREKMIGLTSAEEDQTFYMPLDEMDMRRLMVSLVPGQPDLFFIILRDDTEIRRVEQMRKDFIANVSHELRTPLTAVRGYVETLMDPQFLNMETVQQFLPIIFEHTERLHNLMLDLLSLSRLESPNTRIDLTPVSLEEELQDALDGTAPLARMKNISVELKLPESPLRVLANTEHLERVLVNLLDNAIKYSNPSGRVVIWTEQDGEWIWTHVQDEGQGIPPEELPRVFERFYRTKGAVSGRARGTGLGLAISKHIVQQLGGEIKVQSQLGEGSDFMFSLRLAM